MSGRFLGRHTKVVTSITVSTAIGSSTAIDVTEHAGGTLYVDSSGPTETWDVYAEDPSDGTYLALYDKDGGQVQIAVQASRAFEFDPAVFGCKSIKLLAPTTGDTVAITLKS